MTGEFRIDARGQQAHSFALCEHLRDAELDNASRALAILARQRRRDSELATPTRLDEFLPAQPAPARDLYALRERPVYNIQQQALLARYVERRCMVASTGTTRIVPTFSCVLGNEGMFGRMLIPSEAETAGITAEETNEMRLMSADGDLLAP